MKMKQVLIGVGLSFAVLLSGCATTPSTLVGQWNLARPDSPLATVTVQDFGDGTFYMHGNTPMDGVYRKDGDKLTCTKPDDPRLHPFTWRIQDERTLVLIEQPDVSISQERLLGSLLTRATPASSH